MDAIKSSIVAVNAQFMECWEKQDASGLSQLYTEDASLLVPGKDAITGRAGIFNHLKGDLRPSQMSLTTEEVICTMGDNAVERGNYIVSAPDGQVKDNGKYVIVWQKVGNSWKIRCDILNSSCS